MNISEEFCEKTNNETPIRLNQAQNDIFDFSNQKNISESNEKIEIEANVLNSLHISSEKKGILKILLESSFKDEGKLFL